MILVFDMGFGKVEVDGIVGIFVFIFLDCLKEGRNDIWVDGIIRIVLVLVCNWWVVFNVNCYNLVCLEYVIFLLYFIIIIFRVVYEYIGCSNVEYFVNDIELWLF